MNILGGKKKRPELRCGDFDANVYFVKSVPRKAGPGPCRVILQTVVALCPEDAVAVAVGSLDLSWRVEDLAKAGEKRSGWSWSAHSYGGFDSVPGPFTDADLRFLVARDFFHVPYGKVTLDGYSGYLPDVKVARTGGGVEVSLVYRDGDGDIVLFRCRDLAGARDRFEDELDFRLVFDPALRLAYSGRMSDAVSAFVSRENPRKFPV